MPVPVEQGGTLLYESAAMDISVRRAGLATVLEVAGEIDLLTGPAFTQCVGAQVAARPRHLVIDLAAVSFFGSPGIRALLGAAEAADATTTTLHVSVGGNRIVARTLQITGLASVVDVQPDTDGLVAALTEEVD